MSLTPTGPVCVLVGAPGSGKTTVGRLVAERLGVPFRDTDADIEVRSGSTIGEIFVVDGEEEFRRLEREAVAAAVREHGGVLSLGGGAVVDPRTRERLVGLKVIWLQVSAARATARVGMNTARPALLGNVRTTMITMLKERAPMYAAVATDSIETDALTVDAVADAVLALIGDRG